LDDWETEWGKNSQRSMQPVADGGFQPGRTGAVAQFVAQFGWVGRQYAGNRAKNDKPQPGRLIRRPGLE